MSVRPAMLLREVPMVSVSFRIGGQKRLTDFRSKLMLCGLYQRSPYPNDQQLLLNFQTHRF